MKIASYNVEQQSVSKYQMVEKQQVNIQIQRNVPQDAIDISEEGLHLQEIEEEEEDFLSEKDKRKIEMLEKFIQWLTGKEFKFKGVIKRNGKAKKVRPEGPSFGMRISSSYERYEKESMKFSSSGQIQTEDGRSIDFDFNLKMSRETYERSAVDIQIGEFHDPLVMNFDGQGIDFSDKKIRIDVDLDGNVDEINFLNSGSGFLAIDNNENGKVDDGSELFGPRTNNGFAELAEFDHDGNFWIDENDNVFSSLKIWTIDQDGNETLLGLKEAGIGAIYLGEVEGAYTIKHGDEDMAKIKGSSIYLRESGEIGSIHEIDLKL